jgi:hypothetical protein
VDVSVSRLSKHELKDFDLACSCRERFRTGATDS